MPRPRANPPSEITFNDIPERNIKNKVAATQIGIESASMIDSGRLFKKYKMTKKARIPPIKAARATSFIAFEIYFDLSTTRLKSRRRP